MADIHESVVSLEMTIEQRVRRQGMPFQLAFARDASALLPPGEAFALHASYKGLHVLARNEEALAVPVETLRDVYGDSLVVEPPRVRLLMGAQVQEPVMHVRISLQAPDCEAVKRAMLRRGASPSEEYARSSYCVLRYEAPLADLLGLPAELARLTDGSAKHWIALSHYAVVDRGPGGHAA